MLPHPKKSADYSHPTKSAIWWGPRSGTPRPALSSLSTEGLRAWLAERGQPAYRDRQVRSWLARGAESFEGMRDLPGPLRAALDAGFRLSSLEEVARSEIAPDQTTKYLYRLDGGYTVEAVIMRYPSKRGGTPPSGGPGKALPPARPPPTIGQWPSRPGTASRSQRSWARSG